MAETHIDSEALAGAIAFAAQSGTAQLMVIQAGEVLADEVFVPDPVDAYAVQKGLVAVLLGMAADRGLVDFDAPVSAYLGAGWTQLSESEEAKLTIHAVLSMTTGVDNMLRPLGEVGVSWRYDNVSYNYLKTVLEVVTDRTLSEVTADWLCDPLGMSSTRWVDRPVERPDGRPITGLLSTARDLARFGSFILAGGEGIAPRGYIEKLGNPGSSENPSWGRCWWNNDQVHHRLPRRESEVRRGPPVPDAPPDMIMARGAIENRLCVVPSLDLVVARTTAPVVLGERPTPFDQPFWQLLIAGARR